MSRDENASPDEQAIRQRAYALWEAAGKPHGQHEEFWHRAAREMAAEERSGSLDDQLADTFPASDPLSISEPGRDVKALPAAPEDEPAPARSATLEEPPTEPTGAKKSPAQPAKPKAAPKSAPAKPKKPKAP